MQTALERLAQHADGTGLHVHELALGVRDIGIVAIETADDEDLSARESECCRVGARM
jgi:hypothetical protein